MLHRPRKRTRGWLEGPGFVANTLSRSRAERCERESGGLVYFRSSSLPSKKYLQVFQSAAAIDAGGNTNWNGGRGMNALLVILGVGAFVAVAMGLFVAGAYNGLVALRNRYKSAYSQIDVQLKRRHDLIPNLVEAVKGYMGHEKGTLEAVIQARNSAVSASKTAAASPGDAAAMSGLAAAEGSLNGALGRLFALAEAYPDLKANQNMMSLQQELSATENQVAGSRQIYNDVVMRYNTQRETFPTVVVANFLNFSEAKLFELDTEKEREAPRVSF